MVVVQIVADGNPGGGTEVVLGLSTYLKKLKYEVKLITRPNSYCSDRARFEGIEVIPYSFFSFLGILNFIFNINKKLQEIKPDVIHIHGTRAAFICLFLKKLNNSKYVYTVHGYHYLNKNFLIKFICGMLQFISLYKYDLLIHVCSKDSEIAKKRWSLNKKIEEKVIYNGVRNHSGLQKKIFKSKKIVFLGRFCYQKNPELYIDIMKELVNYGYFGLMIGGGELEDEIQKKIMKFNLEDKVIITGKLSHFDAIDKMEDAFCMVLTSRWEGFPLATLEAMSLGVPVVATAVDGVSEQIVDGIDGFLVEDNDKNKFIKKIRLLENDLLYSKIMDNARQKIDDKFSYSFMCNEYVDSYKKNRYI